MFETAAIVFDTREYVGIMIVNQIKRKRNGMLNGHWECIGFICWCLHTRESGIAIRSPCSTQAVLVDYGQAYLETSGKLNGM